MLTWHAGGTRAAGIDVVVFMKTNNHQSCNTGRSHPGGIKCVKQTAESFE